MDRCPCDCKSLPPFTEEEVTAAAPALGLGLGSTSTEALQAGMNVELSEHCDITHGDPIMTAKIALAHLREDPLYYDKLTKAGL